MNVKSQSPSQKVKLKKCDSCKRDLPLNGYFGILRSSRSGYNPTCRECRRYLRKQTYYKGKYDGTIYPLKANNRNQLINRKTNELTGTSLATKEIVSVGLDLKSNLMKMELINSKGISTDTYYCSSPHKDEFLAFIIDFLTKRRIRLTNGQDDFII